MKSENTRLGEYHTIAGMAEALGVAENTLAQYIRAHGVKVTKIGATTLVRLEDLDGYRARIGLVRKLVGQP